MQAVVTASMSFLPSRSNKAWIARDEPAEMVQPDRDRLATRPTFDMVEVTRLTREGKLEEAMVLLRAALSRADLNPTSRDSDQGDPKR
jgi:hypothetical protein